MFFLTSHFFVIRANSPSFCFSHEVFRKPSDFLLLAFLISNWENNYGKVKICPSFNPVFFHLSEIISWITLVFKNVLTRTTQLSICIKYLSLFPAWYLKYFSLFFYFHGRNLYRLNLCLYNFLIRDLGLIQEIFTR